jgi:RHS repeat-associated protein
VQQSNSVYWIHEDPVTKSKRTTDLNGNIISAIELDPWGADTNRSGSSAFQPKKLTSYERDSNGGDEAMFRRCNRKHSRFDQPDPYEGSYSLTDPQSFNRYSYTQSDPVNFTDPSGLDDQPKPPILRPFRDPNRPFDPNFEQPIHGTNAGEFPGFSGSGGGGGDNRDLAEDLPVGNEGGEPNPGPKKDANANPGDTYIMGPNDACVAAVIARYAGHEALTMLKQAGLNGGIALGILGMHFFAGEALGGSVAVGSMLEMGIDIGIRLDSLGRAGAALGTAFWLGGKLYPKLVRESFNNKKAALNALRECYK